MYFIFKNGSITIFYPDTQLYINDVFTTQPSKYFGCRKNKHLPSVLVPQLRVFIISLLARDNLADAAGLLPCRVLLPK